MISGGAFQFAINGMYKAPDAPSDTGHTMIAIDPEIALDHAAFLERMRSFYTTIKASPMWESGREMLMPGELEYRTQLRREREGIPCPPELLAELNELGRTHGVTASLAPLAAA